jgi:hypothetical protein
MTITFESDNNVIVYALEKVISYPRRTQQIFVAQCVWWLASVIGLEQGLVNYIDNLEERSSGNTALVVSPTPRDDQEDSRLGCEESCIHPDREGQVQNTNLDISNLGLNEFGPGLPPDIVASANQFLHQSRKE